MPVFEILMIICFGVAWPLNVYSSIKTKSTKGKNLWFILMIVLAYCFGIMHKLFYARDPAIYFYLFNMLMVLLDLGLYVKNRRSEIRKHLAERFLQAI